MAEEKSSRIVFKAAWRDEWVELLKRKTIGQQTAVERLIEFLLAQDDVAQSLILGQIDPSEDSLKIILQNAAKNAHRRMAAKYGKRSK